MKWGAPVWEVQCISEIINWSVLWQDYINKVNLTQIHCAFKIGRNCWMYSSEGNNTHTGCGRNLGSWFLAMSLREQANENTDKICLTKIIFFHFKDYVNKSKRQP